MKVAVVIPARLGSKRFPGKVLARATGKYLVEHVHERVKGCPGVDRVILATDSEEVRRACLGFGAEVAMTSPDHASGTDRVAEVARGLDHEVLVNVQGDEPLIEHDDIQQLVELFRAGVVMTTLVARRTDVAGFVDPNIVKAVLAPSQNALYFSRAPVPHAPSAPGQATVEWFQHIGIYAYRRDFLLQLSQLPPTPLEKRERLEQLRVLENGFTIRAGVSPHRHLGIDTPEEYQRFAEEYLQGGAKKC